MSHSRYMDLALSLGRQGLGQVWPNPSVGCVIVKQGRIIGRGRTAASGRPHAEAAALAQAGRAARGADVYVTLEPCAHPGRDESCSDKLITAGVSRVFAAVQDPFPHVDGQGFARLRAAGIAVEVGIGAEQARHDHRGFFLKVTAGRPLVTLKLATSLDGRIATASGESRWITGPLMRRRVHLLRATHDAVLVGSGTVRADDPDLTVRDLGITRQPVAVILASDADIPTGSRIVRQARDRQVLLVHGMDAPADRLATLAAAGLTLLPVKRAGNRLDLKAALGALAGFGLTRVLCEGGGQLAAGLIASGLVDDLILHQAGLLLGADGLAGLAGLPFAQLSAFPRFEQVALRPIGGDIESLWQPISLANKS